MVPIIMMFVHKGYYKPKPSSMQRWDYLMHIQVSAKIKIFGLLNTAYLPCQIYSTVFKDYVQYIYFSTPMLQVYLTFR